MSKIEWTDTVWNPVVGCSPVSEGCRNCYAAKEAIRLGGNPNPKIGTLYAGTSEMRGAGSKRRAVFTGKVNLVPERLDQPLRWRKSRRVFVNSMSDLFHESVPFEYIDQVFAVMAACHAINSGHTFQVLTKRPERMAQYLNDPGLRERIARDAARHVDSEWADNAHDGILFDWWPLPNVWLGTSVEDQAAADERIPHLLRTPATVRFLSCEPLLGPVDLTQFTEDEGDEYGDGAVYFNALTGERWMRDGIEKEQADTDVVHWVIVGGESGPGARRCDVAWIRSLVQQCHSATVPVFVKQLGARPYSGDTRDWIGRRLRTDEFGVLEGLDLRDRKGGDPAEWPEDLRVREYPQEGR